MKVCIVHTKSKYTDLPDDTCSLARVHVFFILYKKILQIAPPWTKNACAIQTLANRNTKNVYLFHKTGWCPCFGNQLASTSAPWCQSSLPFASFSLFAFKFLFVGFCFLSVKSFIFFVNCEEQTDFSLQLLHIIFLSSHLISSHLISPSQQRPYTPPWPWQEYGRRRNRRH